MSSKSDIIEVGRCEKSERKSPLLAIMWLCVILIFMVQSGQCTSYVFQWPISSFPLQQCREATVDILVLMDPITETSEFRAGAEITDMVRNVFVGASIIRKRVQWSVICTTDVAKKPQNETKWYTGFDSVNNSVSRALGGLSGGVPVAEDVLRSTSFSVMEDFGSGKYHDRTASVKVLLIISPNIIKTMEHDWGQLRKKASQASVKIILAMNQDMLSYRSTIAGVADYNIAPKARNRLSLEICGECTAQWIPFKWVPGSSNSLSSAKTSCHRQFKVNEPLTWLEAYTYCVREHSAYLSQLETKEELNFFVEQFFPSLNRSNYHSDDQYLNIYIGLKRERSMGNRFTWTGERTTPMTYDFWAHSEPKGGHDNGCAYWMVPLTSLGTRVNGTVNPDVPSKNQWYSTGCGKSRSATFVCETSVYYPDDRASDEAYCHDPPSESSVIAARNRGQLVQVTLGNESDNNGCGEYPIMESAANLVFNADNTALDYTLFLEVDGAVALFRNTLAFQCHDLDDSAIPYSLVCDRGTHCPNNRDELFCHYRNCRSSVEFRCGTGECIPAEAQCDQVADCPHGEDEANCVCQQGKCEDGTCLPKHWLADGEIDCSSCDKNFSIAAEMADLADENAQYCIFTCNRKDCIYTWMLRDNKTDCQGPEGPLDQILGELEETECYENDTNIYANWAPKCVFYKDRNGAPIGCRNNIHLKNCTNFTCPEGFFKCHKSYCIPVHYVKDGIFDCPNWEDERSTRPIIFPYHFKCARSDVFLHPDRVCDGRADCVRGDDELGCHVRCHPGVTCIAGAIKASKDIIGQSLTRLDFVDTHSRFLDLSGTNLSHAWNRADKYNFIELVFVNFSYCEIFQLNPAGITHSLIDFSSVLWLDVSHNHLGDVESSNFFSNMVGLIALNISHNIELELIADDAFISQANLETLDLSYTGLRTLNYQMFVPIMQSIKYLRLQGTRLVDIQPDFFPSGLNLKVLDLRAIDVRSFYQNSFKNVSIYFRFFTDTFKLCCPQLHSPETNEVGGVCKAPDDPFSSCDDLMRTTILTVILWINACLAIVGNASVLIYRLFYDRTLIRVPYGQFVTHLSASDLLMGIYLLTIATADIYYRGSYVWEESAWRNSPTCTGAGFLSALSCETSTVFIGLITIDRYLVVKFPFGQFRISPRMTAVLCSIAWVFGLAVAAMPILPPFMHWETYSSNGMCLALPLTDRRLPGWEFSVAIFLYVNMFFFLLVALGQFLIYRAMAESRKMPGLQNSQALQQRRDQDFAIAKHLSVIALTDFLCWFPIGVMALLALEGHPQDMNAYAWTAVVILPINSAINPVIYTIPALIKRWRSYRDHHVSGPITKSQDQILSHSG